MPLLREIYGHSLALLVDLYELTMGCAYLRAGKAEDEGVFHLFFRTIPFGGGYAVVAGLEQAMEFLQELRFDDADLAYLRGLEGNDRRPLFGEDFLSYLANLRLHCDVAAIPEGTVVFGGEPLVRVAGPMIEAQIVESALLNIVNFQTLIATKSARICQAAAGDRVLEFGMRRAQGVDGSLTAARAAFIGGCYATSNLLAGKLLDIPVRGTHAHSWVMSFEEEMESFTAYAKAMPNNSVFLVDTYDTLQGVRHAIEAGKWLREHGHILAGIRLDSGDLAYLSIEARKLLDAAGFTEAAILASNDLDERLIESLKQQGAKIMVWGVGTRLVTGHEQSALGGVYKLGAYRKKGEANWRPRIKLSEHTAKTSVPGVLQVRRFFGPYSGAELLGDMIYDESAREMPERVIVDPGDSMRRKTIPALAKSEDLLVPIMQKGEVVYPVPELQEIQHRAKEQVGRLHSAVRRLVNPHIYPVGLDAKLAERRTEMILQVREKGGKRA